MSLEKFMKKDFVMLPATSSLVEVAKVMLEKHVGDVIVSKAKNGKSEAYEGVVGILTDRDLVLEFAKKGKLDPNRTAGEFIKGKVTVASVDEGLGSAIEKMNKYGVRRVPVVNASKKVVGILCADDCLEVLGTEINSLAGIVKSSLKKERSSAHATSSRLRAV
ncbi:MAG: CBS domain-containing protein [Bdellovibrio sp.]|nr:CBS domain-containing protein [Bdellovibrio sp.]